MADDTTPPTDGTANGDEPPERGRLAVEPIEIQEEMENSFLDYAMSVITARALPDVRDGLKPVHRRILWGMLDIGARPDRSYMKCARVTGDVMGRYHPHSDTAIYDALVRMAQDFSLRHPLVDPHGNFGSPDFGPAASRYTECRLDRLAMVMLQDIDEETVDFVDNYSGEFQEPVVLPSRFPNLLVNGSQGIAVGMATNIPPHNLGESIDAVIHLLDNPEATPDDLMQFVKGPDFPTGGLIMGRAGIMDAYRTGKGSIKVRARTDIVEGTGRQRDRIVVTEMPYQTSIAATASKIKDLVEARTIEGIADVNDESSGGDTRLVIELKKDAPALVILNNLFKHTPLQTNFAVNTVALVDGVPRTLNLVQMLQAYIDHQVDVIRRRSQFRLDKARRREHLVEGLLKAINVIDEVIALIRSSDDRAAARAGLMAEPFEFSVEQAEHILDMRLGQLTRLARIDLETELESLRETIADLEQILADEGRLRQVIRDELLEVKETYADERRSEITYDIGDIDIEDLIDDEELVVTMSQRGYVKTVPADTFRAQGRGGRGVAGAKLRDDDYVTHILTTTAHAYLLFFSNRGRVYRLKAHEIPRKDRTARGTAIVNLLPLQPGERIQAIIDTRDYETHRFLFFATRKGQVKKTKFNEYDSSLRSGLIAINLRDDDELVRVIPTNGTTDIFMVARSGMTIRFSEDDVRSMGRAAAGVRGMKLRPAAATGSAPSSTSSTPRDAAGRASAASS
jgi:DNA gyrase subunit A